MAARLYFTAYVAALTVCCSMGVRAQAYPDKPIRMVTGEPGGSGDFASRVISPGLTARLGQQIIVDNRSGTVIPGSVVAKAAPDGYTLLLYGAPLWIGPLLQKASYDPVKGFSPITLLVSSPNILAIVPQLPVTSVKELIAYAKAKPGAINYGAAEPGSGSHLAAELFKSMAGVNIVGINYKGVAPAVSDLIAGQVQMMFSVGAVIMPHVRSNRLRALAVTSAEPSALAPGLPTIAASGLPGYEYALLQGLFAPAGTPATIVKRLNQEAVQAINQADVKEKFFKAGTETVGDSPDAFAGEIKADIARLSKVIHDQKLGVN